MLSSSSHTHPDKSCVAATWPVVSVLTPSFLRPVESTLPLLEKSGRTPCRFHRTVFCLEGTSRSGVVAPASIYQNLSYPLQSSAVLEIIRTTGRVALTFIPVLLVKNHTSRRILKKIEIVKKESGDSTLPRPVKEFISNQGRLVESIRRRTILFHVLVFTPCILFWAAVIASLERTPLTGR